jgi:hypothetical protein
LSVPCVQVEMLQGQVSVSKHHFYRLPTAKLLKGVQRRARPNIKRKVRAQAASSQSRLYFSYAGTRDFVPGAEVNQLAIG